MNPDPSTDTAHTTFGAINLLRQSEVAFWCQIFAVDPAQVREAVQHVGHQAVDVARYLRDRQPGT